MAQNAGYSLGERTDLELLQGEVERNSAAAVRLYAEMYAQRLREAGRRHHCMTNVGRLRNRRSAAMEKENVVCTVERSRGTSTRRVATVPSRRR